MTQASSPIIYNIHYKPPERVVNPPLKQYMVSPLDGIDPRFGSMRCYYKVWKTPDMQADIMGFQGYRKNIYFGGKEGDPRWSIVPPLQFRREQDQLDERDIFWHMQQADILITAPFDLRLQGGIIKDFATSRSGTDFMTMVAKSMMGRDGYNWNQPNVISHFFVMRKPLFNEFMDEWWRIFENLPLENVERPEYSHRAYDFLTERFFTVWLDRRNDLKRRILPLHICWEER